MQALSSLMFVWLICTKGNSEVASKFELQAKNHLSLGESFEMPWSSTSSISIFLIITLGNKRVLRSALRQWYLSFTNQIFYSIPGHAHSWSDC